MQDTHDLNLPAWGPYTKKYMGISHIPDPDSGVRFDLSVFPGYYRGKVRVPNVMWENGYHPWEASPDLTYFCHRHDLEWKDQVYADISFSRIDDAASLIRAELVNNTDIPQNLVLHYMASLHLPALEPYRTEPVLLRPLQPPAKTLWVEGVATDSLTLHDTAPTDNLVPDGRFRCETRDGRYVHGSALGQRFSAFPGDSASYTFHVEQDYVNAVLVLRLHLRLGDSCTLQLSGLSQEAITISGEPDTLHTVTLNLGALPAGDHIIALTMVSGEPVAVDGLGLVEMDDLDGVSFETEPVDFVPQIVDGPTEQSILLKYADADPWYGVAWDYPDFWVREFRYEELDTSMPYNVHHHTSHVLGNSDRGHYTNIFMRPITIEPHSTHVVFGLVCSGERETITERLSRFPMGRTTLNGLYASARARRANPAAGTLLPSGSASVDIAASQERMAATILTNVVYPVYLRDPLRNCGTHVRHACPGRWWDSLYTWDSGFIGLGFATMDETRTVDNLNAYMLPPGDQTAAFLHHGSPVPVQFYLFKDLWDRTQNRDYLAYFYPRLQQYHRFMAGRLGSSTTRSLPSNLLKTWDYFYNSGGWDDYPPQVAVHMSGTEATTAPMISSCQVIRTARMMRAMHRLLDIPAAESEYTDDISALSEAVLANAWDEESGYFGYVVHDAAGKPDHILRHEPSGANYDMGLDGLYPLVAGVGTSTQRERMLSHLANRKEIYSRIGLSAVDQTAPYYTHDGYWNGTVWLSQQWFFWKALLDYGQANLAADIAHTGLDLWAGEVAATYNCYEHFIIESGRGAGWHCFGGLSSPALQWFDALYHPGRVTVGLDAWVLSREASADNNLISAHLWRPDGTTPWSVLVVPGKADGEVQARWNGELVAAERLYTGALAITLPADARDGTLDVSVI